MEIEVIVILFHSGVFPVLIQITSTVVLHCLTFSKAYQTFELYLSVRTTQLVNVMPPAKSRMSGLPIGKTTLLDLLSVGLQSCFKHVFLYHTEKHWNQWLPRKVNSIMYCVTLWYTLKNGWPSCSFQVMSIKSVTHSNACMALWQIVWSSIEWYDCIMFFISLSSFIKIFIEKYCLVGLASASFPPPSKLNEITKHTGSSMFHVFFSVHSHLLFTFSCIRFLTHRARLCSCGYFPWKKKQR